MMEHWNTMPNLLRSKYLQDSTSKNVDVTAGTELHQNEEIGDLGYIGSDFIAVGVYYCSSIDQFSHIEDVIVDPIVDGARRTWRLVSAEYVAWMAGMVAKAFESDSVSPEDLSAEIMKFYRVRDRIEQEIQNHERESDINSENVRRANIQRDSTDPQSAGNNPIVASGTQQKRHGNPLESRTPCGLAEDSERGQCSVAADYLKAGQHLPGGAGEGTGWRRPGGPGTEWKPIGRKSQTSEGSHGDRPGGPGE